MAGAPEAMPHLRVAGILAGVLAVAVLVFSLGVMVGRRAAESAGGAGALAPEEPVETIAPPSAVPVPPERMTFYDRLSGQPAPPGADLPTGSPPPASGASGGEPTAGPVAPVPAPAAPARPTAPPPVPASSGASSGARGADGGAVARLKGLVGRGPWAVQVAAVSQEKAAGDLAARYRGMGFEATTAAVSSRGRTLHRVRVGTFPDRAAAARAAEILRAELDMPGSIPVRR